MNHTQPETTVFPWPRSRDIHIIAIIPAALTLLSSFIGGYWFCSMQRRNFRQVLILSLIVADGSKAFWIFIFSVVGLVKSSRIKSDSVFCQLGGFCLQFSFEACDLAILLLTMHVSAQILLPKYTQLGREGLYCVRNWVLSIAVALPAIDAAVPFARYPHNTAYAYDGAYCSLFTGPLWMNLALSWVPRYLIWLFIVIVLISLYFYIRSQTYSRSARAAQRPVKTGLQPKMKLEAGKAAISSCIEAAQRKLSLPTSNDRKSRAEMDEASIAPWTTIDREDDVVESLEPINVEQRSPRQQAQRLMFYPMLYVLAWSVPFSAQCVAYSTTHSVNSVFPLRAASVFCVALLGSLDVLVFCWRERPWRYSVKGAGLIGSLRPIQRIESSFGSRRSSAAPEMQQDETVKAVQRPIKAHKSPGRKSDQDRRLAQLAYDRLALEQADAMMQIRPVRSSAEQDFALLPDVSLESL